MTTEQKIIKNKVGLCVQAQTTIGGTDYWQFGASETVVATFTVPDGGVTTGSYSGFVEVIVSGSGESEAQNLNDAFWVFTDGAHVPLAVPYHNVSWYQLSVDTSTLPGGNHLHAKNLVVYDVDAGADV